MTVSDADEPRLIGELVPLEAELVSEQAPDGDRDQHVSDATASDLRRATAANTERAYARWWNMALAWCEQEGRTPLPMTAQTVAEFIGHLKRSISPTTGKPYSPASLDQALSAIRTAHFRAGFEGQPQSRAARDIIKVHRQDRAREGWRPRRAKPVTLDVLRLLLSQCDTDSLSGRRNAAILVLGYGLMGRRSELAAVTIEQVTVTDEWVTVFIPISKTDTNARGEDVDIPRAIAPDLDAGVIVRSYLEGLAEHGVTAGPLLRRVDVWGNVGPSMTAASVNDIVKRLAKEANLTAAERTTAHGLRAGAPTDAAERGVPVPFIAEHGRWSKNSTQVLTYVRPADRRRNNPLLPRDNRA
ncbi:tyrosine-type recombinase/integrase [Streptomyces sp. NPDC046915]|uniref:tyrosine-type recombinase/integrase n=1 Tax=Streptomyces sp. NPDC046915 TaxID=3155257 RepID=UPI0033C84AC1